MNTKIYKDCPIIVLLDSGHGIDTKGKRSPKWDDGTQLREYEFNRDITARIAKALYSDNILFEIVVHETNDVPLKERVRRVNELAEKTPCLLISIHANAGGGNGWEVFTTEGETDSDKYAQVFAEQFEIDFPDRRLRADTIDGDLDKEAQFYILRKTTCPAILTENFFMDNESECKLLMDNDFRQKIADFHVNAIKNILS